MSKWKLCLVASDFLSGKYIGMRKKLVKHVCKHTLSTTKKYSAIIQITISSHVPKINASE